MITFLLTAILFALLLGLPALRRGLGVLALLALLFMLWATVSNIDGDKRSPSKTDTKHEPPSATDASPSRDGAAAPPAPRPYRQQ
jgi:hypothetical protein